VGRAIIHLRLAAAGLALALWLGHAPAARAAEGTPEPASTRTVFDYGYQGLWSGTLMGLSIGYLFARDDGFKSGDWKPLAYGGAIGALAGSAVGLTFGVIDLARDTPGLGYMALRGTGYGLGFGMVAGGVAGGVAAISTKKPEHILLGAAIGSMVGGSLGLVLGAVEGNRDAARKRASGPRYTLTVAVATEADGGAAWLPALVGRF
jgi:hypothetical protein